MKRISIGSVLVISLLFPSSSPVNAAVKAGATCTKEKQIVISNNYLYQCKKFNKKLFWKKGSKVIIESPGLVIDVPTPTPTPTSSSTVSQSNAVLSAQRYLKYSPFSRSGLIKQLEFEGFSNADAVYGVDKQNADWSAQAILSAQRYLKYSPFSRSGLIKQLEFEGFTNEQAIFGVNATGL
jgi:hypothetical protein